MMIEKGTELNARLLKADIHPVVKDTLVNQQQQIFFLRKELTEQAQLINGLVDNFLKIVNANDAMMQQYKKVIAKNQTALQRDAEND